MTARPAPPPASWLRRIRIEGWRAPSWAAWAGSRTTALYPSPLVRGAGLARVYLAAELLALMGAAGSVVTWIWHVERPRLPQVVALLLIAAAGANLAAGAWRRGIFDRWHLAQLRLTVTYLVVLALEVHALWKSLPPSSRSSWRKSSSG